VPKGEGDKYRYALQWKLPCVTPEWVEASKAAGHVLPFKDFEVEENLVKSSTPSNSMIVPVGEIDHSMGSIIPFVNTYRGLEDITLTGAAKIDPHSQLSSEDLNVLKTATKLGPYLDGCKVSTNQDN